MNTISTTISLKEARANFGEILARVHRGKKATVITKFGQPFIVMMPVDQKISKKISLKLFREGRWTKLARQAVAASEAALRSGEYKIFDYSSDLINSLHKTARLRNLK